MRPQWRLTSEMSLIEVLRLWPGAADVFEEVEIDYACGGATSVRNAAAQAGLTPTELLLLLELRWPAGVQNSGEPSLFDLIHVLERDHEHVTSTLLPRVRAGIAAAIEEHGGLPGLRRLRELEWGLSETISSHAYSEEQELFPIVEDLQAAVTSRDVPPPASRISPRVLREVIEHESVRDRLHAMREVTNDLLADYDVETLATHVRALQRHLHVHMHLENNILYPRAIAYENELRHAGDAERR